MRCSTCRMVMTRRPSSNVGTTTHQPATAEAAPVADTEWFALPSRVRGDPRRRSMTSRRRHGQHGVPVRQPRRRSRVGVNGVPKPPHLCQVEAMTKVWCRCVRVGDSGSEGDGSAWHHQLVPGIGALGQRPRLAGAGGPGRRLRSELVTLASTMRLVSGSRSCMARARLGVSCSAEATSSLVRGLLVPQLKDRAWINTTNRPSVI